MNWRILSLLVAATLFVGNPFATAAESPPPEAGGSESTNLTAAPTGTLKTDTNDFIKVTVEKLRIGTNTYLNALVSRTSESNRVLIVYGQGRSAAGINRYLLTEDLQEKLGYLVEKRAREAKVQQMDQLLDSFKESVVVGAPDSAFQRQVQQVVAGSLAMVLSLTAAVHLFYAYCLYRICRKTGKPSIALVWFPVLQVIPSLRAAAMSTRWLYLFFVSVCCGMVILGGYSVIPPALTYALAGLIALCMLLMGIVGVVWCFKICIACGKTGWLGILFFVPVIGYFMLPYLAFSPGGVEEEDKPKSATGRIKL